MDYYYRLTLSGLISVATCPDIHVVDIAQCRVKIISVASSQSAEVYFIYFCSVLKQQLLVTKNHTLNLNAIDCAYTYI